MCCLVQFFSVIYSCLALNGEFREDVAVFKFLQVASVGSGIVFGNVT